MTPPTIVSSGNTAFFDAAASVVSFANDTVVGPSGDPIVGAAVDLSGLLSDRSTLGQPFVNFTPGPAGGTLTMHNGPAVYLMANVDLLTYDVSQNLFSAELSNLKLAGADPMSSLFGATLANIDSPSLLAVASVLDPNAPLFDPNAALFITYQPDAGFFARSAGFSTSASSFTITNAIFVADTPEPSGKLLLGSSLVVVIVMAIWRKRRRTELGVTAIQSL